VVCAYRPVKGMAMMTCGETERVPELFPGPIDSHVTNSL